MFSDLELHPDLQRGIAAQGFPEPTPIQREAIPPALVGRDVLACAATGTGKTAAFALPIVQRLIGKPRGTTRALVLTPTRELAAQVDDHLRRLARHTPVRAAAIYGGVPMGPQQRAFRAGVDVVIATPGRLLDHLQYGYARLDGVEMLVLDEADRMLDMGFLPAIRRILQRLPTRRQTLFFSATLPPAIVGLTREMLRDPATIRLGGQTAGPAVGVTQAVYPVRQEQKTGLLLRLLADGAIRNALVFTRTKHRADRLARALGREGVEAELIHGGRNQSQRTRALANFKSGRSRVLVATDVAARGIDVTALSHVVNFDVPAAPEDYVHRVGRTARASATGDALTFVAPEEEGAFRVVERALGQRVPRRTAGAAPVHPAHASRSARPVHSARAAAHAAAASHAAPPLPGHTQARNASPRRPQSPRHDDHRPVTAGRKRRPKAPWHARRLTGNRAADTRVPQGR